MVNCIRDYEDWNVSLPISFKKSYYAGIGISDEFEMIRLEQELALYSSELITPICFINGEGIIVYMNTREVVLQYHNGNAIPKTKKIPIKTINRGLYFTFDSSKEGNKCKEIIGIAVKARLAGKLKPFKLCVSQEEASINFKRYCKQFNEVLEVYVRSTRERSDPPERSEEQGEYN